MAERLTLARASTLLADSPEMTGVEVLSAGVHADQGAPMDPRSARALEALGGDPTRFHSQRLTAELAQSADLVLTMTRQQRQAALRLGPKGLRRTFTLTEAAALAGVADLSGLVLTPIDARAQEFGRRLDAARARRPASGADDITDPMGQRAAAHADVAARIDRAISPLSKVLFTSVRSQLEAPVPA